MTDSERLELLENRVKLRHEYEQKLEEMRALQQITMQEMIIKAHRDMQELIKHKQLMEDRKNKINKLKLKL